MTAKVTGDKQGLSRDEQQQQGMASDPDSCELTTETLITVLLDERVMNALTSVISRAINEVLHKPTALDMPDSRATTSDDLTKTDILTEEPPSMTTQSIVVILQLFLILFAGKKELYVFVHRIHDLRQLLKLKVADKISFFNKFVFYKRDQNSKMNDVIISLCLKFNSTGTHRGKTPVDSKIKIAFYHGYI